MDADSDHLCQKGNYLISVLTFPALFEVFQTAADLHQDWCSEKPARRLAFRAIPSNGSYDKGHKCTWASPNIETSVSYTWPDMF